MKELYYKVAGHVFALETDCYESIVSSLSQYEPFATDSTEDTVFRLSISSAPFAMIGFTLEMEQEDEGQEIICALLPDPRKCSQSFLLLG